MKKHISIVILPAFLIAASLFFNTRVERAIADVPAEGCPAGSMRLGFGDGSTTAVNGVSTPSDPWQPAPAPAPNPNPAPAPNIDWDSYLDDGVINEYNRNGNWRNNRNVNEQLNFNLPLSKAYAQWDEDGGGGGAPGSGPACAQWSQYTNSNNVAHLACIVMQEQGGGPFCLNSTNNTIFNGLMDNTCRQHPGTSLAGFRIVATFTNYACGVASPVTDG
jgi:hypothetical protein